ncbi:MAG: Maf family protein [Planctomycetota bacterium]
MARIVLASASPRRRELLAAAGVEFEVIPADVDESLPEGIEPEAGAVLLARTKAVAVGERLGPRHALVLAADTIVALGDRFLGKPADAEEARSMLRALSLSRHAVVTGVAVLRTRDGALVTGFERTWVTMREISPDEIEAYVRSGEWQGKAGGYAIQESADRFVTRLEEGGFDNVVGLPVALTLELLARQSES